MTSAETYQESLEKNLWQCPGGTILVGQLHVLLEKVRAEEREACARAATRRADEFRASRLPTDTMYQAAEIDSSVDACLEVAAEIRARASDADAEAVDDGPAVDVQ